MSCLSTQVYPYTCIHARISIPYVHTYTPTHTHMYTCTYKYRYKYRYRYRCRYTYGQFSKVQSGKTGPAPGRFDL